MSIADTNRITPRSALRHRSVIPELEIPVWSAATPRASRISPAKPDQSSAENLKPAARKPLPSLQTDRQLWHWAVPVGLTITAMVLLTLLVQLTWNWGTSIYNNLHYGMPRTTQVDAFVGHESGQTPSHFIAENLHGRVLILELPGGDPHHVRVFVGPQIVSSNADQVPIVLSFADHNGDHLPDMIVQFGSIEIWYANQHGTFVPQ